MESVELEGYMTWDVVHKSNRGEAHLDEWRGLLLERLVVLEHLVVLGQQLRRKCDQSAVVAESLRT